MKSNSDDKYNEDEAQRRLAAALQGAFSGAPTPLKDVPTRWSKKRAERKDQPPRKRRQRKNRAA